LHQDIDAGAAGIESLFSNCRNNLDLSMRLSFALGAAIIAFALGLGIGLGGARLSGMRHDDSVSSKPVQRAAATQQGPSLDAGELGVRELALQRTANSEAPQSLPPETVRLILQRLDRLEHRSNGMGAGQQDQAAAEEEMVDAKQPELPAELLEQESLIEEEQIAMAKEFAKRPASRDDEKLTESLDRAFQATGATEIAVVETECRSSACRVRAVPQGDAELHTGIVKDWLARSGRVGFSGGTSFVDAEGNLTVYLTKD
jgi:hypothetical protein